MTQRENSLDHNIQKAGEGMFGHLEFHDDLKAHILEQIKQKQEKRLRFRSRITLTVSAASLVLAVSIGWLLQSHPMQRNIQPDLHRPAHAFSSEIDIQADSYPLHARQSVTLSSKNRNWTGKQIPLYSAQTTDDDLAAVQDRHVLPQDAKPLGTTLIENGQWHYSFQIPFSATNDRNGSILIIAKSDTEMMSSVELLTLKYDKLELMPSVIRIGQTVKLNGAGFVPDSNVLIKLTSDTVQNGDNVLATLGSLQAADGSFDFPFTLAPTMKGHTLTPGAYKVQAVFAPPNSQREMVTVPLTTLP